MTDAHDRLREVGDAYQKSRQETQRLAAEMADEARQAYADGMRKADIVRAINHAWTERHLDTILKDVEPPPTTIRRVPRTAAKRKPKR